MESICSHPPYGPWIKRWPDRRRLLPEGPETRSGFRTLCSHQSPLCLTRRRDTCTRVYVRVCAVHANVSTRVYADAQQTHSYSSPSHTTGQGTDTQNLQQHTKHIRAPKLTHSLVKCSTLSLDGSCTYWSCDTSSWGCVCAPRQTVKPIFHDFSSAKYAHQVSDLLGGARFLPLG